MRRLLLILARIVFPVMATAQTRPMTYEDILGVKRPADPQNLPRRIPHGLRGE